VNDEAIAEFARRINESETTKGVVYVAGGGTEVFPMLLARGGGSATLLAGRILYAPDDFRDALGYNPERFVEPTAARGLAMAAFRHALAIRGDLPPEKVFGLGSTSKLSTGEGERAGRSHAIHATFQTSDSTYSWSIIALPDGKGRAWEERINALFLLNLLAFQKVGPGYLPLEHDGQELPPGSISIQVGGSEPAMADLIVGRRRWVALDFPCMTVLGEHAGWTLEDQAVPRYLSGRFRSVFGKHAVWTSEDQGPPQLLLPGSFRPLHDGHVAMAETAARLTGLPCCYELSLFHPEKTPLNYLAVRGRIKDFINRFRNQTCRLYLTNAPTYIEKARLFPGCTFVVGHDTALRIVDPRFYGGPAARDAMLDELERLGTRFLVFGRVDASGQFRDFSAEEFEHPVSGFLSRVATPVPGQVFRLDISSTEVRRRSEEEYH
jgi:hypothetical protein